MDSIVIPLAALDSPKYKSLSWGDQRVLIDLYIMFWDCDCFTVDLFRPQDYRQSPGVGMGKRIQALLASGLLVMVGKQIIDPNKPIGERNYRRVFAFKYPAVKPQEAA
jgi:hypothetical protein